MGKIYDLIKSASYHAWDGDAIRKMAKAIDEGGASWYGTQEEYDAIKDKNPNITYYIYEEE